MSLVTIFLLILNIIVLHIANLRRIKTGDPFFSNKLTLEKLLIVVALLTSFKLIDTLSTPLFNSLSQTGKILLAAGFFALPALYFLIFHVKNQSKAV